MRHGPSCISRKVVEEKEASEEDEEERRRRRRKSRARQQKMPAYTQWGTLRGEAPSRGSRCTSVCVCARG